MGVLPVVGVQVGVLVGVLPAGSCGGELTPGAAPSSKDSPERLPTNRSPSYIALGELAK